MASVLVKDTGLVVEPTSTQSSRRGSEETENILDDGREEVCQEPMEEEEVGITTKPKAHKAKKRRKRGEGRREGWHQVL